MSASMNKVILIGRLGKDPEVRYTSSGKAVANFSLATDESYKNAQGEKQKKTEWHNLVAWGETVEKFIQPYLHKGDLVAVEGKLQTRSWEKDGEKKYTTEINITNIVGLVTAKTDGGAAPASSNKQLVAQARSAVHRPPQQQAAPQTVSAEVDDSEIPF